MLLDDIETYDTDCNTLQVAPFYIRHQSSPPPPRVPSQSQSQSQSSPDGIMDIWILAGQSNSVGINSDDGLNMNDFIRSDLSTKIWQYAVTIAKQPFTGDWFQAVPNITLKSFGFTADKLGKSLGPDMAFAYEMLTNAQSSTRTVGFIPTAIGGSSITTWQPNGVNYDRMINVVKVAMSRIGNKGILRGLIFVQGEADATSAGIRCYEKHMRNLVNGFRQDLSEYHMCLPFILAIQHAVGRGSRRLDEIRKIQNDFNAGNVVKVDMLGHHLNERDTIHLSKRGVSTLGKEMALQYIARNSTLVGSCSPLQPITC